MSITAIILACGSASMNNSNTVVTNAANRTTVSNSNANDMVPGSPTASVSPSTNTTPGITATNQPLPKGATPTPGIPDPKNANKPMKPGATPTPGIPDPETIRRQMSGEGVPNINTPPKGPVMMPMNKNRMKPGNQQ
jgi:hypothetical protein